LKKEADRPPSGEKKKNLPRRIHHEVGERLH
jgi:hypothetical protein